MVSTPSMPAGQQQVLQHDLRLPLVQTLQQFLAGRRQCRPASGGKGLEVGLQTATDDAVIVNDGDRIGMSIESPEKPRVESGGGAYDHQSR